MTYAVLSDIHCHTWTVFSSIDHDGVNSRLRIILNEWERCARELIKAGGKYMIIPGDIFHVRGSIDPEVLNPVQATVQKIMDMGIVILSIPGNHDLKGRDTTEVGSAIQNLRNLFSSEGSFDVFNEPKLYKPVDAEYSFAFVPWQSSKEDLLASLQSIANAVGNDVDTLDVFIHAGIDGVLPGLPAHGLTDVELAAFGFKRVFAGDYHNHKVMQGGKVISVGATTHQTWRDLDSKAGFLLCDASSIKFMDTHAPKFIDVSGQNEDDMALMCDGNYVRFRGGQMTQEDIKELREFFVKNGALGTSIQVPVAATATQRTGVTPVKQGQTVEQSVAGYIDTAEIPTEVDRDQVKKQAAEVLAAVRAVYEDN